jgi:CO/xanthine dehydrogenase Mo-binding subunit
MAIAENLPSPTTERPIGFGRLKRKEDARFIRGQGTYLDDIRLPGMVHMAILRSPFAHAKINSIDTSAALALPGVAAVITAKDLETLLQGPRPKRHVLFRDVVVARPDMRRAERVRVAGGNELAGAGDRIGERLAAVVDAGEEVGMNVDPAGRHRAACSSGLVRANVVSPCR